MKKISIIKNLNILKIINLLGYFLNKTFKPKRNFFQPISVDIEPGIFCNLRCKFCHNRDLKREKRSMNIDDFKKILDNFHLAIKVNIQGMGEPLLNPDIIEMIKYAKYRKKFVTITSNGMLLNKEKTHELIASGLDRLIISIDSGEKEAYEEVRSGASFDQVVYNISQFVNTMEGKKKPKILIWMLGLKETISGLPKLLKLANKMGVDEVVMQNNITGWGKDDWEEANSNVEIREGDKRVATIIKEAWEVARKEKVNFTVNNKFTIFKKDKDEKCNWPWGGVYVASDGSIVPCCLVADPEVVRLGNVLHEDFKNIWNNSKYQKLRYNLKNNKLHSYCRKCYK